MKASLEALDIGSRTFVQGIIDAVTLMVAHGGHPVGFVVIGYDDSDPQDPALTAATGFDRIMRDLKVREYAAQIASEAILEGSSGSEGGEQR